MLIQITCININKQNLKQLGLYCNTCLIFLKQNRDFPKQAKTNSPHVTITQS